MPRGKGRGGRCKSQNANNFGSDVEMKDAGFPGSKARDNNSFKPKHESDRRSRVGKNSPSPQFGGGTRGGKPRGGANAPVSGRTRARGSNNKRLSIISTASTTASQAGPWCDKCTRLNRQLHGYLLEILKSGEDAIGDWAYAVGASPDHMDCEPAPERIIPEGYRRCSRQHHPCASSSAMMEGEAGSSGALLPPSGCASMPYAPPFGAYSGRLESTPSQSSAGTSPFSQLGSGLDLSQRTNEALPALAGVNLRTHHTLVAIPENVGLQDPRPGPSSQALLPAPYPLQPPWRGGCERPVAMYPN